MSNFQDIVDLVSRPGSRWQVNGKQYITLDQPRVSVKGEPGRRRVQVQAKRVGLGKNRELGPVRVKEGATVEQI